MMIITKLAFTGSSLLENGDIAGGDTDDRDNMSDEMSASADKTSTHADDMEQPYHHHHQQQQPAELLASDEPLNNTGLLFTQHLMSAN